MADLRATPLPPTPHRGSVTGFLGSWVSWVLGSWIPGFLGSWWLLAGSCRRLLEAACCWRPGGYVFLCFFLGFGCPGTDFPVIGFPRKPRKPTERKGNQRRPVPSGGWGEPSTELFSQPGAPCKQGSADMQTCSQASVRKYVRGGRPKGSKAFRGPLNGCQGVPMASKGFQDVWLESF